MARQKLESLIAEVRTRIDDPTEGLPEEVFLFVSSITPMVNVDLLIKDSSRGTLLTWRGRGNFEPGWHLPGGILRYQECFADRLKKVAHEELKATVEFGDSPVAINEIIYPDFGFRGHFISLLYECSLESEPAADLRYLSGEPRPGQWAWHQTCPETLYGSHELYRKFI